MYFTVKFASLLLAVAASAQAAVIARNELDELSVVFFDDVNYGGTAFSPQHLQQDVCNMLPDEWLDRAESLIISSGYTCTFYLHNDCGGSGTPLFGSISSLPDLLYNNIESFICHKN